MNADAPEGVRTRGGRLQRPLGAFTCQLTGSPAIQPTRGTAGKTMAMSWSVAALQ
jgi:hypothetical protein